MNPDNDLQYIIDKLKPKDVESRESVENRPLTFDNTLRKYMERYRDAR